MTKDDLIRLLADFNDDTKITFDAGGCSGWHYSIDCVAHAIIGRRGKDDSGEMVVLLCEVSRDDDDENNSDVLDAYVNPRRLETRRRFTDFEIVSVSAIVRRKGGDPNGVHSVLLGSQIDQPDYRK